MRMGWAGIMLQNELESQGRTVCVSLCVLGGWALATQTHTCMHRPVSYMKCDHVVAV